MESKTKKNIKLHIKKGDIVLVIAGADKGKKGKVVEMFPQEQKAIVEKMKMAVKHLKPTAANPSNKGIVRKEMPIHISNLMLVDVVTGSPIRTGRKRDEKGKLQRYSKKTGQIIKND